MLLARLSALFLVLFCVACSNSNKSDDYARSEYDNHDLSRDELIYKVPKSWTRVATSNPMRIAQYEIVEAGEQATLAIYTFPGQVGGVAANITRWQNQFKEGVDKKTAPVKQFNLGPFPVSIVKISGTYLEPLNPMNPSSAKKAVSEQALLAAIVEQQNKSWFFKLLGDSNLVDLQKKNFMQIIASLRLKK